MEIITIKMEREMLLNIDGMLKKHNYGTRTEFIRNAIREKLEDLNEGELIKRVLSFRGKLKTHTSDKKLREIREIAFKRLVEEKGWNLD